MKTLSLLFLCVLMTGCVSTSEKEENIVLLPKANKAVEIHNLQQAKEHKVIIGEKHNLKFEFYFGPKGSYYVVINPKNAKSRSDIELKYFDVVLEVDKNGKVPETIMLAEEYASLYSGFGSLRSGKTNYTLKLIPQDGMYGKPFSIDFKANIGSGR